MRLPSLADPRLQLDIQCACKAEDLPDNAQLRVWAEAALDAHGSATSPGRPHGLVIRIVEPQESRRLNRDYRGRDKPTNVLSFPFERPPGLPQGTLLDLPFEPIGDLVICAPVVESEAVDQGKALSAHWAHMVVHGVLHLLGHDHLSEPEAEQMEDLERQILARLGFPDPYTELTPLSESNE